MGVKARSGHRCREMVDLAHLFLKNSVEFSSLNTGYHVGLTVGCLRLYSYLLRWNPTFFSATLHPTSKLHGGWHYSVAK